MYQLLASLHDAPTSSELSSHSQLQAQMLTQQASSLGIFVMVS
jgi:hypothetical protein